MPMGYGMGYGLASYRQLLAAVSTERFAMPWLVLKSANKSTKTVLLREKIKLLITGR